MGGTCKARRGRSITEPTARALYAHSAGFCQKPECNLDLLMQTPSGSYLSVGEIAHVIAASTDGPRADLSASEATLTALDNLILLCAVCHTLIDKAPDDYPTETVMRWKSQHLARRRQIMAMRECSSRSELRVELERLLTHNAAIHALCGPESEAAADPMSDAFELWQQEVVRVLIPNNRKVVELLDVNFGLLNEAERQVVGAFRLHVDAFEARHVLGQLNSTVPRFPAEMNDLAKDAHVA